MAQWIEIKAKFNNTCKCGKPIVKGQDVLFYSSLNNKCCLCVDCSQEQRNALRAERSMEQYGTDIY